MSLYPNVSYKNTNLLHIFELKAGLTTDPFAFEAIRVYCIRYSV